MAKRKPKPKFLKRGDEYIYLTGECPTGFDDALFVAWSGIPAVESVEPVDRLKGAKEVNADDVPDDVYEALVDAGACDVREIVFDTEPDPEPKPEPKRRKKRRRPEPQPEDPDEKFAVFQDHIAGDLDMMTACAASGFLFDDDAPPRAKSKPKIDPDDYALAVNLKCLVFIVFVILLIWFGM